MIRDLIESLSQEQKDEMMEAFNNEVSYILILDDHYLAVHFTPDPSKHQEIERSTYWSAGTLK